MFWLKHIILFNTNSLEQFTRCLELSNTLNSMALKTFFKKLKNKEQDVLLIKTVSIASKSISNCCLIFGNVSTSEGARTIFDFRGILELVQLLVGL